MHFYFLKEHIKQRHSPRKGIVINLFSSPKCPTPSSCLPAVVNHDCPATSSPQVLVWEKLL